MALTTIETVTTFSNALMGDLQHPNEYIRGSTLRFLCKLREAELLEPLLPSARSCLVSSYCLFVERESLQGCGGCWTCIN